jgi:hypothetical protein
VWASLAATHARPPANDAPRYEGEGHAVPCAGALVVFTRDQLRRLGSSGAARAALEAVRAAPPLAE